MRLFHCSRGVRLLLPVLAMQTALAAQQPATSAGDGYSTSFIVFFRGAQIGREDVTVTRSSNGWAITSSGTTGLPVDFSARRVQVRYTPDWKPLDLTYDVTLRGQPLQGRTEVSGGHAHSTYTATGQTREIKDVLAADAIFLPNPMWGPFEALSQRLTAANSGATLAAYGLQVGFQVQVGVSRTEMFQTATRVMAARRTTIKMVNAGTVTEADIWFEPSGRLLRISIPSQNVEVVREDIASVAVRHVLVSRPNDIAAKVQSTGFSIAATISRPETSAPRLPVVVLVSGSGPTDRDENLFGVPIFGQLANALADRGFAVVRYDKRGSGQSGGRPEAANIADYAEDLKAVVRTIRKRKDIDEDRVALVGYGEGGPIALTAARDGGVTALVLISAMGVPGAEYNLWQTTQALDRSDAPPNRRAETIELQKKIQSAVLTGTGWEGITPQVQEQADTPWFRTFLAFNPEVALRDVKKPVLVVHPLLDTETPPLHADRFEAMAGQRKNPKHAMKVVRVPGVNHLLVAASTGSIDEYPKLSEAKISPAVVDPLAGWLTDTFAAVR